MDPRGQPVHLAVRAGGHDPKQKPVIFVTPGKGKGYLVLLRSGDHNNIAEVVGDMSPTFLVAIGESFPGANVTVDWFHVVQLFTTAKLVGRGQNRPARAVRRR